MCVEVINIFWIQVIYANSVAVHIYIQMILRFQKKIFTFVLITCR